MEKTDLNSLTDLDILIYRDMDICWTFTLYILQQSVVDHVGIKVTEKS